MFFNVDHNIANEILMNNRCALLELGLKFKNLGELRHYILFYLHWVIIPKKISVEKLL